MELSVQVLQAILKIAEGVVKSAVAHIGHRSILHVFDSRNEGLSPGIPPISLAIGDAIEAVEWIPVVGLHQL
jgi:hypothetical protein